jgi:protein-disulfide isomerase
LSRRGFGVAIGAAVLAAAALILASLLGAGETSTTQTPTRPAEAVSPFAGIPESGLSLGARDAPVTLVEYADLQCPYCALWAADVLPVLVRDYVRPGRVRLVFHGLAFLGPDSETALRASLAAAEQNRLWPFVHELYARQGPENGGWVNGALAPAAGRAGVQLGHIRRDSHSIAVERQMLAARRAAERAGVHGTPSFELGRTGGRLELVEDGSLESLRARLDALLAR